MKTLKRWTEQENQELCNLVSENLNNLTSAFRQFHVNHNDRTVNAISTHWYEIKRNNSVRVCKTDINTPKPKLLSRIYNSIVNLFKRNK
jgi:hypothetical protein